MTTTQHQPALILWDIDHTLVDIGKVSRELYAKAFAAVTGRPLRELADMTGRTEQAILIDTMAMHGISDPEATFEKFMQRLPLPLMSYATGWSQSDAGSPVPKKQLLL